MCFDAQTSIATFSISILTSSYLYYSSLKEKSKNTRFFSIVIILIGLMQLLEYFIWKNQECTMTNHHLSLLVLVLITMQPILGLNYYNYLFKSFNQTMVIVYSITYIFLTTYIIKKLNNVKQCSKPTKESCRLHWDSFKKFVTYFPKKIIFLYIFVLYFGPQLLMGFDIFKNQTKDILKYPIRHGFLPITFLITLIYVSIQKSITKKMLIDPTIYLEHTYAWGSMWCFMAVFLGIVSILKI